MRTNRYTAIAAAAAVLFAACSSSPGPEAGNRSRLGDADDATGKGQGNKKVFKKARKVAEKAERQGEGGSDEEGTSSKAAGEAPAASTESQINPAFARRTASIDDPRDDGTKEGITPAYAEIVKASIVGLGEDFRMTLTLDGQVPNTMPNDKTHMIIAFGITGTEESEGYSFGAQATEEGWNAYAGGRDDGNKQFPGTFFVKGNSIEMTVPWDFIEGPRAFEWYAAANWFSQLANQTHYRVDLAPNDGLTKFPQ
jgi:hypothetical protein